MCVVWCCAGYCSSGSTVVELPILTAPVGAVGEFFPSPGVVVGPSWPGEFVLQVSARVMNYGVSRVVFFVFQVSASSRASRWGSGALVVDGEGL